MEDLEFDSTDAIKTFLNKKLQEIQNTNACLEKTKETRLDVLNASIQQYGIQQQLINNIVINKIWKRMYLGKYIICINLINNTNLSLENILLDKIQHYNYNIYDMEDTTNLIFTFDIPKFNEHISIVFNAVIVLENNSMLQTEEIQLSANDLFDFSLRLEIDEFAEDFIACLVARNQYDFSSNFDNGLEDLLEQCSLRKVTFSNKSYFIIHNTDSEIHGSIFRLEQDIITIYSKSIDCLIQIIHFLHQKLNDVIIIPNSEFQKKEKNLKSFRKNVFAELNLMKYFFRNSNAKEFADFYNKLSTLEHETDFIYFKKE